MKLNPLYMAVIDKKIVLVCKAPCTVRMPGFQQVQLVLGETVDLFAAYPNLTGDGFYASNILRLIRNGSLDWSVG